MTAPALRKILVVDDDIVVGSSFNRVLSANKGYVVTTAENAHEALNKMREQSFDMVFTDIKMPGMDGVELAEKVKASQPWVPVVIITGYGTKEEEDRARTAGVTEFVRKPMTPETIEAAAAYALLQPALVPVPAKAVETVKEPAPAKEPARRNQFLNALLFLMAPFIGLLYAVLLPFVGLAMLLGIGGKALVVSPTFRKVIDYVKPLALFAAAPFIGLAYVLALPFIGIGMLVYTAGKAVFGKT